MNRDKHRWRVKVCDCCCGDGVVALGFTIGEYRRFVRRAGRLPQPRPWKVAR